MSEINENLKFIDQEIRILHEICTRRGHSPIQIEAAVKPFINKAKSVSKHENDSMLAKKEKNKTKFGGMKRKLTIVSIMSVCIVVAAFASYEEITNKAVLYAARASLLQLLPLWDWRRLYEKECIVANPLHVDNVDDIHQADCKVCEDLKELRSLVETTEKEISEDYLMKDIPVVVTNATNDWKLQKQASIQQLDQIYNNHEVLKMYMCCNFASSHHVQHGNQRLFLRQAAAGEITHYYAHWENCFGEAARSFRDLYQRPFLLPPMVEISEVSWVFVSSHFKEKIEPLLVPFVDTLVILAQLEGTLGVVLEPRDTCATQCKTLQKVLHQGDILLLTDYLYDLKYIPSMDRESITLGLGATFD